MAGEAESLGLYGFGAAAHIVAQVARWQGRKVYAFTRPGDIEAQEFAREMGAAWAGGSFDTPPEGHWMQQLFSRLTAHSYLRPFGPSKKGELWCVEVST